jgi:DNA-binding NtrC family response regulator/tetratricopeptide (TPR) repeat protein
MTRLIADRFLPLGPGLLRDLATGEAVPEEHAAAAVADPPLSPLVELLDHGEEGAPRWIVIDTPSSNAAARTARRAAADAQARGFVPIALNVFPYAREALESVLRDRSLLLIAGPRDSDRLARHALLIAAATSPRPHTLLTIRAGEGTGGASVVREARPVYGDGARPARMPPVGPDVERHRQRAGRAREFVLAGRHAAAERLLRDVAASLTRRRHPAYAARIWMDLGHLLLERGRVAEADKVFDEAAVLAATAPDERLVLLARTWQASARIDAGRLTDAEALCRAALPSVPAGSAMWTLVHATLARALLWQGRISEAAALDLRSAVDAGIDPPTAAFVAATAVRVAVADGQPFLGGQLSRDLLTRTRGADPLVRSMAATAHLRVLTTIGDPELVERAFTAAAMLARQARAPLRVARARLIYAEYLRAAGRPHDARREQRRLERLTATGPALLARAVRELGARLSNPRRQGVERRVVARDEPVVIELIATAQDQEDDRDAVGRVLERVGATLRTSRIDLVSAEAGPATAILSIGSGLHTSLGERVLEAGIVLGPETAKGGTELAVPVQRGRTTIGGLVARWPVDRTPPDGAPPLLELAAAIVRPRLEAMQSCVQTIAHTATLLPEFVGASTAMAEVRATIARAAAAPFAVLIQGESGVGKELAARAIHQLSPRRERRFCDLNCAALPEDLLDSELFGHARGAFTGALTERPGLFEDADGGTVFLDEIADLSARGQAKLLRVVQQQEVRRVGETFARKVDVRIVAAANRDMRGEAGAGRFRDDLLYRLDVIRLRIPSLRERPDDVPLLAQHFWQSCAVRVGTTARLTHGVMAALARYHWPGNVRELQNVMAALAVAAPSRGHVRVNLLPAAIAGARGVSSTRLADARAQLERRMIESAIARAGGSRTRAARELGLSRQGLLKMMARVGVG